MRLAPRRRLSGQARCAGEPRRVTTVDDRTCKPTLPGSPSSPWQSRRPHRRSADGERVAVCRPTLETPSENRGPRRFFESLHHQSNLSAEARQLAHGVRLVVDASALATPAVAPPGRAAWWDATDSASSASTADLRNPSRMGLTRPRSRRPFWSRDQISIHVDHGAVGIERLRCPRPATGHYRKSASIRAVG